MGEVAPLERYLSKNKRLTTVADGGSLYLVTVRKPGETLVLVAVLEEPEFVGDRWVGKPNRVAMTDISDLVDKFEFDNGAGLNARPGRLGMSLQTPRILSDSDVALLDKSASWGVAAPAKKAAVLAVRPNGFDLESVLASVEANPRDPMTRIGAARACVENGRAAEAAELLAGNFVHLNAHDPGALPCLCKKCLTPASDTASAGGTDFIREFAVATGRVLYFWVPAELARKRKQIANDVAAGMRRRFGGHGG
jgi:hypothetical protein